MTTQPHPPQDTTGRTTGHEKVRSVAQFLRSQMINISEFTDFYKKNIAQPNSPCVDSKLSQDGKALLYVRLNDHTNDVSVVALGGY